MNRTATVCESCLEAVREEVGGLLYDASTAQVVSLAREWGADIADHICDARDNGEPCGCGCRVHDKGAH